MKKSLSLLVLLLASVSTQAGVIAQDPLFISAQADPRVMLVASRDHQLFIKAYTDYSDLDGDGSLDVTFTPYIEYDGYFNPRKCYTYQNDRFEATAAATTENYTVTLVDGVTTVTKPAYVCANQWSGNLLNWATMTRVDILRKVLYGGYRSTDTEELTVLERAHLPIDVHAFAKVFVAGSTTNMNKFTPYADQSTVSFCNLTNESTASKSSTNPPAMQVANGAFRLWASTNGTQCGTGGGDRPANLRETRNVRVKVCDDGGGVDTISGPGPKCKSYLKTGAAKKPVGILQQYGDANATSGLKFGLMTGSWAKNKSGGVLRKNIGSLSNSSGKYPNNYNCATAGEGFVANSTDEIDFCTGIFVNNQGKALSAAAADDLPATGGVIGTLNRLRILGWNGSKYDGVCKDPGATTFANGHCIDWGNPISEIYLESLRYLRAADADDKLAADASDETPTTAFNTSDTAYLAGMPQLTWKDPIPAREWCAKSNVVMISTGLNSFDTDETTHDLEWPETTVELTNKVAASGYENLSGNFMIGSVTGASTYESLCSSKALGNFANASGICPEVPSIEGSYHVAGLALGTSLYDLRPAYQTNRQALWGITKPDYAARQPLSTYAIALAESLPNFTVPVGGGQITFLPFCQANTTGAAGLASPGWRACSMVDLVVEPGTTPTKGSFRVMWEDSTWGNDYDMDGVVHIRYCVGSECNAYAGNNGMPLVPEAGRLYIKVASMTASAGHALKYGYTISGSTADGSVLDVLRPGGADHTTYDANSEFVRPVASWTAPTWVAYMPSASGSAGVLKNPLWYTAKYAAWPDWDVKLNDATRATGSDGIPDNFFQVRNPAGLDSALGSALRESLGDASSASSIAANSTRLDTDTFIYQARFKALDWSGQVLAYPLTSTGGLGTLAWDAAASGKIPAAGLRRVFTYDRSATFKGIELSWASLSGALKAGVDNANAANASSPILNYLRGDQSLELTDADNDGIYESGVYRKRPTSVFGDIINADPVFVGNQNYAYGTIDVITGYATYQDQVLKKVDTNNSVRNPLVLVNANDGMMHAIDGKNGNEAFAYMPSWLLCPYQSTDGATCYSNSALSASGNNVSPLRELTNPGYQHRYMLDGAIAVGDAYIDRGTGASWKTVIVGAAAAGGKGIYALDLTASYDGSGTTTSTSPLSGTMTAYANLTAANVAMWEFTDKDYDASTAADGDADLGYTYGVPVIGRVATGQWVAIFANGYNSATGKAALFIVNLATGKLITKIEVGDGSSTTSPNGLSSPAAIFDPETGAFSAVFAGDLKGNLWKFDLSDDNSANWKVAYSQGPNTRPLFVARDNTGNAQPITGPLEIGTHPDGGYMVYFGTGKYFEKDDDTSTEMQTIYGIWDRANNAGDFIDNADTNTVALKRVELQEHKIIFEGDNPFDATGQTKIRITDDVGAVPYSGGGAKRGWFMNLVVGTQLLGERVVSAPILRNRRIIFTTIIPNGSPCEFGGTSWIMEFDPMSGNRLSESVFDLNGDGEFTSADYVEIIIDGETVKVPANGVRSDEGMIKSPAIISGGGKEYKISSGTTGNVLVVAEKGAANRARASWRQIR